MKSIVPELDANKILIKDSPKAKGGDVYAHTRSRSHKLPEHEATNTMTAAYALTAEERAMIAAGADLYVSQVTYATAPHDILLHVGVDAAATYFDIKTQTPDDMAAAVRRAEVQLRGACDAVVQIEFERDAAADKSDTTKLQLETLDRRLAHARKGVEKAVAALVQARQNAGEIEG